MSEEIKDAPEWVGDVMNRRPLAQFLSNYIEIRMTEPRSALTVAIDADWGAGKTFFIRNWENDLRATQHGTIIFDAWKNDMSTDPVLGFMAELQSGMQTLREKIPIDTKVSNAINTTTTSMLKAVRKAIVPAGTLLATGLLKKATGIAADELLETFKDDSEAISFDIDKLAEAGQVELEKSLDLFFKKTLEEHRSRTAATATFRAALQKLVAQLREANAIRGPLYIFVDELDRCRPDYAIRLLEGIKHLFSVEGVVFIVSTNMSQLSKSVQAVYGPGFDGTTYLQRFFDLHSSLPAPNNYSFARKLFQASPSFQSIQKDYGLSEKAIGDKDPLAAVFSCIADTFKLPLRTQELVFTTSSAALSALPPSSTIALIWLFFLAALRQSHREDFERLARGKLETAAEFASMVKRIADAGRVEIPYAFLNRSSRSFEVRSTSLATLLQLYFELTVIGYNEVRERAKQANDYPQTVAHNYLLRSRLNAERCILNDYLNAVNSAGLLG